jgi:hypothetical protein
MDERRFKFVRREALPIVRASMTLRSGKRGFWLLVAGALFGLSAGMAAGEDAAYGPLWHEFKLTLDPGHRTEILGPLFYREEVQENDSWRRTWAIPPLIAHSEIEEIDAVQTDILWKVISYKLYGREYRFQIVQLFSVAGGSTQSETNVHRFSIFPIYFQQRSPLPDKNYTALLPIYGTIKHRFARDEIQFAGFPLWVKTRKREVVTENYLYPVFHWRHGPAVKGWQVWPLLGRERKDFSTITNVWGDPEPVPGHRKAFVLWPIFSDHRLGLGTTNEAHAQAVLPIYSKLRSPLRDSITAPWPLGYTHTVDREKKFEEWGAPWPLIVFARGEGKYINRVWPFFSHGTNRFLTSRWYGWPIYKYNRLRSSPLDRERTRILFFLYSDTRTRDMETARSKRRVDAWPLFAYNRELDGDRRLQLLAPLESILPGNTGVQRSLSPLWSLWRSEANPQTKRSSQSFLWNLFRRDVTPEWRKGSLLFGLFQYESGPDGRRSRLFYIPIGKKKMADAATAPK